MDDLIIRVLGGHASDIDLERLKRWRGEAPENEGYFQEVARIWELTAPEPGTVTEPPTVETLLGHSLPVSRRTPSLRGWQVKGWGLLAASIAALAIGVQFFASPSSIPLATYQAPDDRSVTVTLADGSFAKLAPGSQLEEFENPEERRVALRGRGFFAVARDETRPFTVSTRAGSVRVLGTRFQVKETTDGGLETIVVEGQVAVTNPRGSAELAAGQMARMSAEAAPAVSAPADLYGLLDWPNGMLVFQSTPLSHVAAEVSRHFGRALRVQGDQFQNRRVTAWFGAETFEEVAESLCLVTEATCTLTGDTLVIGPSAEGGEIR